MSKSIVKPHLPLFLQLSSLTAFFKIGIKFFGKLEKEFIQNISLNLPNFHLNFCHKLNGFCNLDTFFVIANEKKRSDAYSNSFSIIFPNFSLPSLPLSFLTPIRATTPIPSPPIPFLHLPPIPPLPQISLHLPPIPLHLFHLHFCFVPSILSSPSSPNDCKK